MEEKVGLSRRRQILKTSKFVEARHLAFQVYKKADGTPWMNYQDTLDNREAVIEAVLQYELYHQLIIPDVIDPPFLEAARVRRLEAEIREVRGRLVELEGSMQDLTNKKSNKKKGSNNGN